MQAATADDALLSSISTGISMIHRPRIGAFAGIVTKILCLLVLCGGPACGQDLQAAGFAPSNNFDLRGLNYIVTGVGEAESAPGTSTLEYANQVKFRVSIRYRLIPFFPENGGASDSGVYLGYRQTSFWHAFDKSESRPFYDDNYRPGIYTRISAFDRDQPMFGRQMLNPSLEVGFFHESNGRDGLANRSLNELEINGYLGMPGATNFAARFSFYPLLSTADENADIGDTIGRGEVQLFVAPGATNFDTFGFVSAFVSSRVWGDTAFRNVEVNLALTPVATVGKYFKASLLVQYFYGYGENLLDYDDIHDSFRFGVGFLR